ncbi:related to Rieske [2Fe-2S] domain protein [Pseudozyma flocculosa]|uniref:Related to Rieske [2Fe-2S] domain protein n=1 Tax=Pseudozyma flocculosa TaxID=84751 RepID=A0A5C3F2Y4_9BASI|nr:related to Rieske [2Fe-2S] domain protein [Pseudozyma flocculosa]
MTDQAGVRSVWLKVAPTSRLEASARHHLTLRHAQTLEYHSLLIFRFPSADAATPSAYYCMEATCPHLGAPLENATIEENEPLDDVEEIEDFVVVCPWHEYDFSLRTGESSHGIKACVYACQVRDDGQLWIDAPAPAQHVAAAESEAKKDAWDIVEIRPVSEAYARNTGREDAAKALHLQASKLALDAEAPLKDAPHSEPPTGVETASSSIPPPSPAPRTLVAWAVLVLNTPEPAKKVAYTRYAAQAFRSGECKIIGGGRWVQNEADPSKRRWHVSEAETPPERPARLQEEIRVKPGAEGKHSLANIEQWAIDLAFDIMARAPRLCAEYFADAEGPAPKMPLQFFSDFVKVAEDEAKHFSLLDERLREMGSHFGALPVHHGLWDSAMETAHSLTARISVVSLVHESRGLDVNPMTIKKFENAGDAKSVETLTTIHLDEITHVSAGHRWLTWLCANARPQPLDPVQVFRQEVRHNFIGRLKGPFNVEDRKRAGLDKNWYEDLVGEMKSNRDGRGAVGVQRNEVPGG